MFSIKAPLLSVMLITSPPSRVITIYPFSAIFKSWVITIRVWLYFLLLIFKSSIISLLVLEPRFRVGWSARIIPGLFIRLLAIDTLCCYPPDNSQGRWFFLLSRQSILSISSKYSNKFTFLYAKIKIFKSINSTFTLTINFI